MNDERNLEITRDNKKSDVQYQIVIEYFTVHWIQRRRKQRH